MPTMLQRIVRKLRYGEPVVVVSGLPRSGTSMTMKMLEAGGMPVVADGVRRADEDNPKGYYEDERVKNLEQTPDRTWLREARGKAIKVIAYLLRTLPQSNNYKVLFMHRDLQEVLASQRKMLERRGEPADTDDARMLALFEQDLEKTRFFLRYRPCFDTLNLNYREVLQDPRGQAARIQAFLERPLDVDAMAAVVDPELYRNRRD